jgi:hypothetical protein
VRLALIALIKVARRDLSKVEYAEAHNAALEWMAGLPIEGDAPRPMPAETARAQFPPAGGPNRHDVFAGLVEVLHSGGFTYRECAVLVDDGWGGTAEQRTTRARQAATRTCRDPVGFLDRTLRLGVKGGSGVCCDAGITLAAMRFVRPTSVAHDENEDDARGVRKSRARRAPRQRTR